MVETCSLKRFSDATLEDLTKDFNKAIYFNQLREYLLKKHLGFLAIFEDCLNSNNKFTQDTSESIRLLGAKYRKQNFEKSDMTNTDYTELTNVLEYLEEQLFTILPKDIRENTPFTLPQTIRESVEFRNVAITSVKHPSKTDLQVVSELFYHGSDVSDKIKSYIIENLKKEFKEYYLELLDYLSKVKTLNKVLYTLLNNPDFLSIVQSKTLVIKNNSKKNIEKDNQFNINSPTLQEDITNLRGYLKLL